MSLSELKGIQLLVATYICLDMKKPFYLKIVLYDVLHMWRKRLGTLKSDISKQPARLSFAIVTLPDIYDYLLKDLNKCLIAKFPYRIHRVLKHLSYKPHVKMPIGKAA